MPVKIRSDVITLIRVNDGATGPQGVSVVSSVDEWYLSTASDSATGGSWSETRQAWSQRHYYWRRVKTTYSDKSTRFTPSTSGYYDFAMTQAVSDALTAKTTAENTRSDLTDTINSTESQLDGKITAVDKKATQTATDLNAARDELSSGLADAMAQAQTAAAAAKVAQTDLNNYMNYKVDPQLKTMSDFMAAYNLSFHQDASGLYITNQNSDGTPADISLRLGNDRISFIQGQGDDAFEVAFISDKQLYITSGEFLNGLRMGNYAFIPGAAGDLSIKKVK